MSSLKPCPFCNVDVEPARHHETERHIITGDAWVTNFVACVECGSRSGGSIRPEHADEEWNTRPIEDELRAERDTLRAERDALREALAELVADVVADVSGFSMTLGPNTETGLLDARALLTPEAEAGAQQ